MVREMAQLLSGLRTPTASAPGAQASKGASADSASEHKLPPPPPRFALVVHPTQVRAFCAVLCPGSAAVFWGHSA